MNGNVDTARAANIAKLNDRFRGMSLDVIVTRGVVHSVPDVIGLLKAVERFNDFNEDNDPHGEHDFGSLDWYGEKIFWKIDYYTGEYQYWCDPLAPECQRVMTVMLAEEY
jgi:hypothetical protein